MDFKGICKDIDRIVVSDPSYGEGVWCRYERNDINGHNWKVQGFVNEVHDDYEGIPINYVEFVVALSIPDVHYGFMNLHPDGSFAHAADVKVKDYTIGMDTACVGFGVNKVADEIKASRDEWQPGCCLRTLTDGEFGSVREGVYDDEVKFIVLNGFLDEDTGYSVKDVFDYLVSSLEIELDKTKSLDDVIKDSLKEAAEQTPGMSEDMSKKLLNNILDGLGER